MHIILNVTVLSFVACDTNGQTSPDRSSPIGLSSSSQSEKKAAKESGRYVVQTFPGNKVEVAGVSVELSPVLFPSTTDPLQISTRRPVGREDHYWIEFGDVTLEIIGSRLLAGALEYEISMGDSIMVDVNGVVFINGEKRTKVEFEDVHYITRSGFRGSKLLAGHTILEGRT